MHGPLPVLHQANVTGTSSEHLARRCWRVQQRARGEDRGACGYQHASLLLCCEGGMNQLPMSLPLLLLLLLVFSLWTQQKVLLRCKCGAEAAAALQGLYPVPAPAPAAASRLRKSLCTFCARRDGGATPRRGRTSGAARGEGKQTTVVVASCAASAERMARNSSRRRRRSAGQSTRTSRSKEE